MKIYGTRGDSLIEMPVYVSAGLSFSKSSYILFYGASLHGWGKNYVPGGRDTETYYNMYGDTNVYWLSYEGEDGLRDSIPGDAPVENIHTYFVDTLHIEEDYDCPAKSGFGWIWEKLERGSRESIQKDYAFNLDDIHSSEGTVKVSFYRYYEDRTGSESGTLWHKIRFHVNDKEFYEYIQYSHSQYQDILSFDVSGLKQGTNTFTVELFKDGSSTNDIIYFNWFEVAYNRKYEAVRNTLKFNTTCPSKFNIKGFSKEPSIFDITDELHPVYIYNINFEEDSLVFTNNLSGARKSYTSCEFKTPLSISACSPYSLQEKKEVKYIIITVPDFFPYANRLKNYRDSTEVVSIHEIYDNFSYGIKTPDAITRFLDYAYDNWNKPGFCLLLGAGTYGYKLDIPKNRIPPYEHGTAVGEYGIMPQGHICYDYKFTSNIPIGRITVKNRTETREIVNKLIEYENTKGPWANRLILIPDDEYKLGDDTDVGEGKMFFNAAQGIANDAPVEADIIKLYLINYQKKDDEKSGVKQDIIKYVTDGAILSIFFGHGNLKQVAHEHAMDNPSSIYSFQNGPKLPFFFFGSCGVGCFDRIDEEDMASYMQKIDYGGTIATMACTRGAGIESNFAKGLMKAIMKDKVSTIGEAVFQARMIKSWPTNYELFADPGTKLPVRLETNDSIYISPPDTFQRGTKVIVTGTAPFPDGFAYITAFTSLREETYNFAGGVETVKFNMYGEVEASSEGQLLYDRFFEGITDIKSGEFSLTFFVPNSDKVVFGVGKDTIFFREDTILPGQYDDNLKITTYLWDKDMAMVTFKDRILLLNRLDTTITDAIGPDIQLFADERPFYNNMLLPQNFVLSGIITDSSGINLIDPSAFMLTINDKKDEIYLASYFKYDIGTCTKGNFSYPLLLREDPPCDTLTIKVTDSFGNESEKTYIVQTFSSRKFKLLNVMNFPNPIKGDYTYFTFIPTEPARIRIKIYTITGRLIKTLPVVDCTGLSRIYWNVRDEKNNELANGIYIYRIEAEKESLWEGTGTAQNLTTSVIGKLMIMR